MQLPKSSFTYREWMPWKCTTGHAYINKDIGDEYHYLLCYTQFGHERTKYVDHKFWKISYTNGKNNEKCKSQKAKSFC